MAVKLTSRAADHIRNLCDKHTSRVRLAIESGGCQGFSKKWSMDAKELDDIGFDCGLVIDPASFELLDGATVDYHHDLSGSYFVVEIPSATSTCGCGTSFSI